MQKQKLFLEATQPAEDATPEEFESFNDLTKQYEKNCKEHKTQLEIAADLVDECQRIGFKKDAYVLDGVFLDKNLMARIEEYGQAWVTRLAKNRLVQVATGGFVTVEKFAATLSKENFTRTVVMTRHGEPRVYWCFGKNMMLKHWRKFRIVISYDNKKLEEELGFEVAYPEGMPVPMLEPIGQKCRFFEMELLQSFVHYIKALVLEKRDTQEVLTALAFKRLNRLAH